MASDDDFFIIRRFQSLNANVILYMQDRISQIEERLKEIHENNENSTDEKRKNSSFRWDMQNEPERDRLMCELTGLLHHYSKKNPVSNKCKLDAYPRQINISRHFPRYERDQKRKRYRSRM
jgi:hypothetical protein